MLRHLSLTIVLAGLTTAATAQTAQPIEPARQPAPTDTADRVEGIYVAPGMTGAPKQRVMTDYDNQPLKKAAPAKRKSSTLSADEPRKAAPLRRP